MQDWRDELNGASSANSISGAPNNIPSQLPELVLVFFLFGYPFPVIGTNTRQLWDIWISFGISTVK